MPLLSRVFKRPRLSGIYSYQIHRPVEKGSAVVKPPAKEPASSSGFKQFFSESGPPQKDGGDAAADIQAGEERIKIAARQGYLKGVAEGKAKAKASSKKLLEEAFRKLEEAEQKAAICLEKARQKAREIVRSSETDIVELAVAIAEKLIQDQLELAPRKVARIVQDSIERFSDNEELLEVYLHPVDLPACRESLEQAAGTAVMGARLKLLPDERLSRGSCRIESENSIAEYLLDDELKNIREALLQRASAEKQEKPREEELIYVSH